MFPFACFTWASGATWFAQLKFGSLGSSLQRHKGNGLWAWEQDVISPRLLRSPCSLSFPHRECQWARTDAAVFVTSPVPHHSFRGNQSRFVCSLHSPWCQTSWRGDTAEEPANLRGPWVFPLKDPASRHAACCLWKGGCHRRGKALTVFRVGHREFRDHAQRGKAPAARTCATLNLNSGFCDTGGRARHSFKFFTANACRQGSEPEQHGMCHLHYCLAVETGEFRARKTSLRRPAFFPKTVTTMNCLLCDKHHP